MKTTWIASRDLSANPGRALAALKRSGRVLVTSNGKPKAIMIPTSEGTVASDLALLDCVEMARAVTAIRARAVTNRTDSFSMKDVDAEVAAVRANRKCR